MRGMIYTRRLTFDPAKLIFSIAAIACALTGNYAAGIILAVTAATCGLPITWTRRTWR